MDRFLNMVYSWFMERIQYLPENEREEATRELFAPPAGADPDKVTQDVIDEEMMLFNQLARQTGGGGA